MRPHPSGAILSSDSRSQGDYTGYRFDSTLLGSCGPDHSPQDHLRHLNDCAEIF